jgi:putative spermidine/putrescine transport system permease protein
MTERISGYVIWAVASFVVVFLLAPLVVTALVSFSPSPIFDLPSSQWSLRWYSAAMAKDSLWLSLGISFGIAALSTLIALVLGTLCAIAIVRGRFPGSEAVSAFMVSPLMLPGLVIGIAILQFFREIGLRDAYVALTIAHVVITLPYVARTVLASLYLFDFSLIDAARTLGYSTSKAIFRVMVPILSPAFITSGLFAFLASLDNYAISIFLTDARTKTLPIQMLQYLEESPDPVIAAISTGLVAMTAAVLIVTDRFVGLRKLSEF